LSGSLFEKWGNKSKKAGQRIYNKTGNQFVIIL